MALPTEIWNQIIGDNILDRTDFLNLTITSRFLSAIAYRALYRDVELKGQGKVELALNTFEASNGLLLHIRWLSLTLGRTEVEWILDFKYEQFTAAINNMKNLRRISLRALFMHKVAPRYKDEMAWTRDWDISQVERLDIGGSIPSSLPQLFGKAPDLLSCLTVRGTLDMVYVDGVTELRCEYPRGPIHKPLNMLKKLSIRSGDYPSSIIDFAPNLKVLAILGYERTRTIDRIVEFKIPRKLEVLGLIFCSQFSRDFVDKISQFGRLEVAVIEAPTTAYSEFGESEVESLAQALPRIQTIGVLCSEHFYSEGSMLYLIKIWKREARKVSADSYVFGSWSMSIEMVKFGIIETLLGFE